ncbi:leucine-rich repeat-containing protein 26 [Falco rusticolus]|uniref:leucine-rich repeat-containing protein 26 n=1 Tax=Falco rusticolus TaxID=120794 RepID=UPI0018865F4C|nr:leucine-rich repeat-containing protein 26 [Falco rusticolus]
MAGEAAHPWGMPCGEAGGQEMGRILLFSSSPACSTHKRLIAGHAKLAAYLTGAVPGRGRAEGTAPHLARAGITAKIFAEKSAAPPQGKPGPGAQPDPGLQTEGGGEQGNAQGCRELSTSTLSPCSQALPSTFTQHHQAQPRLPGLDRWVGEATGTRDPVRGGVPAPEVGEPSPPQWAAMGCWRGPSTMLACLLLLRPLPSPACPAACRCSPGEADCSGHALREVPQSLSTNTSTLWLGYNFITVLGPQSFPPLPRLLVLSLPHNRLQLIHNQALVGLGALQELDLSNNYLTVLTPETFLPLTSLATLNLGSNRLGELEPRVLRVLPQLRALFLQDNPWVCSCGILPLWRWLSHNREKVQEKTLLLCRVPEQLNNYPIMAFGNESFSQCQETSLSAKHYVAFLIIGPFSFMASIFFCTFMGSIIVIYHNLSRESHFWRRPRICRGY